MRHVIPPPHQQGSNICHVFWTVFWFCFYSQFYLDRMSFFSQKGPCVGRLKMKILAKGGPWIFALSPSWNWRHGRDEMLGFTSKWFFFLCLIPMSIPAHVMAKSLLKTRVYKSFCTRTFSSLQIYPKFNRANCCPIINSVYVIQKHEQYTL